MSGSADLLSHTDGKLTAGILIQLNPISSSRYAGPSNGNVDTSTHLSYDSCDIQWRRIFSFSSSFHQFGRCGLFHELEETGDEISIDWNLLSSG